MKFRKKTEDVTKLGDRDLAKRLTEAQRTLAVVRSGDPGKGLPFVEAQAAREAAIARATEARAIREAASAELGRRGAEDRVADRDRVIAVAQAQVGTKSYKDRQLERQQEHREFVKGLAAEQQARADAERERKRRAGLLYEPTGTGGGDVVAALFSSSFLWECCEERIQKDGHVGQILTGPQVFALFWVANLIAEHGGESATIAADTAPHWPAAAREIAMRDSDLKHLERNSFIEIDRQIGSVGTVTYRFGSRSLQIAESFREHWRQEAASNSEG